MIRLRFVTCNDWISRVIRDAEDFWLSHVEAVTPDGKYLGAHSEGGVQARDPGYDKDILKDEVFVDLPSSDTQADDFHAILRMHIGEPYDYQSIIGFAIREDMHAKGHAICSALIVLALRACGWFPHRLAEPAHKIDPRDLYLMLSAIVNIDGKGFEK